MTIRNYQTGEICVIDFKAEGWGGKNKHAVEGFCFNNIEELKVEKNPKPSHRISGTWTGQIHSQPMQADGKKVDANVDPILLWKVNPFPDDFDMMFFFTDFTLNLNNCPDSLKKKLPPTDSRLRPDQQELENGNIEQAGVKNNRLEEKQRAKLEWRERTDNDFVPHYFGKIIDKDT